MRAMIALVQREYIEHRAPFVFGPLILLALMLLAAGYAVFASNVEWFVAGDADTLLRSSLRFYETTFALAAAGWWLYLLVALFFYFSDSFWADSRDNAMLFWKSMPQSDFKMLAAKMLVALTVFPIAILIALALTGIIAWAPALTASNALAGYAPPDFAETVGAWTQILLAAAIYYAIGLLWYAPFFAWVGMLATLVRRWAIPLAFLIPAVLALFERLVLGGSGGGHVMGFLRERTHLEFDGLDPQTLLLMGAPWDARDLVARMLVGTDWISLIAGLAVAVIFLCVASEYRRRVVLA